MSSRAPICFKDGLEAKGPVRGSEVRSWQKEILAVARRLAVMEIVLGGRRRADGASLGYGLIRKR